MNIPPVYEVRAALKNGEEIRGYCRGAPNCSTIGDWLHLTMEMPYECQVVVKIEEIAYIRYRPRRNEE